MGRGLEQETVIIFNPTDISSGYVNFGTGYKPDFDRLCRRIGGAEKLLGLKTSTQDGAVVWWQAKVPVKYFSKTHFGVRLLRPQTPKESAARAANLAKARGRVGGGKIKGVKSPQEAA